MAKHIWTIEKWMSNPAINNANRRNGLRLRIEKEVDPRLKSGCLEFAKWLRKEYFFPSRVHIYIKARKRIRAMDGEYVCGTIFLPENYNFEPYIKVATGDFLELCEKRGVSNAINQILLCIAHELTHYYQWINSLNLTIIGEERQATRYSYYVLDEYRTGGTRDGSVSQSDR